MNFPQNPYTSLYTYNPLDRLLRRLGADPADGAEPDVYFRHGDHLGSAGWVTDAAGVPVQHLRYLPFGGPFVNQRTSGYAERYTFTGKERDEETGYGYFDARYLDFDLTAMWLSVDPMADKYPSISPYAYCAWNPIRLVDPDGQEINPVFGSDGTYRGCTTEGYSGAIIIYDGADDFSALTSDDLIETTKNCEKSAYYYTLKTHNNMSNQAKEKMYAHIIGTADGTLVNGSVFCAEDMELQFNGNSSGNWNTLMSGKGANKFIVTATDKYLFEEAIEFVDGGIGIRKTTKGCYEATVENIIATVVYHEWYGHYINNFSDSDHYKCYEAAKNSPYFSRTTELYQGFIERRIKKFKKGT